MNAEFHQVDDYDVAAQLLNAMKTASTGDIYPTPLASYLFRGVNE